MDIQEIFNRIIDAGFYSKSSNTLMCFSIGNSYRCGIISKEESNFAFNQIDDYLIDESLLSSKLYDMGRPCGFEDCLKIYRNWKNRPTNDFEPSLRSIYED